MQKLVSGIMKVFLARILILFMAGNLFAQEDTTKSQRTWTNKAGKSIPATLVDLNDTIVTLQLKSGKTAKVKIADLSEKDRNYLKTERKKLLALREEQKGNWELVIQGANKTSTVRSGSEGDSASASRTGDNMIFLEVFLEAYAPSEKKKKGESKPFDTAGFYITVARDGKKERFQAVSYAKGFTNNKEYFRLTLLKNGRKGVLPTASWTPVPKSDNASIEVSLLFAIPKAATVKSIQFYDETPVPVSLGKARK